MGDRMNQTSRVSRGTRMCQGTRMCRMTWVNRVNRLAADSAHAPRGSGDG